MTKPLRPIRCAIYTRVSSDQRLEQDFNSLDAQREACTAYIKSQVQEGWKRLSQTYDDGGYSGGSLERPALQSLLENIRTGGIDIVVVYKVDRLTRSLGDFAKLVELFDEHKVSFVSVTQSFNTTSSMGRLTLNVLLSFAQFEREVTGERIRDKIAASKKKGLWVGGVVPLGYRVEDKKLVVEESEAEILRLIFRKYLELGSLPALQRDLRERGTRTRPRVLSSGRQIGGVPLTIGPLNYILRNRVYLGEINHQEESYRGEHSAIIEPALFDAVQTKLSENLVDRTKLRLASGALLARRIFDDRGNRMSPSYAIKKGVRYRYYVSCAIAQGLKSEAGSIPRVPAAEIERLTTDALRRHYTDHDVESDRELVERCLARIEIRRGSLRLTLNMHPSEDGQELQEVSVLWSPQPVSCKRDLVLPPDADRDTAKPMKSENRVRLLRAIRKGMAWMDELIACPSLNTQALAEREGCSERAIRMGISLAFLAPEITQAAVDGRLPRGLGLARLTELPASWAEQRRILGLN
jgi:site-specific DNA recombinase